MVGTRCVTTCLKKRNQMGVSGATSVLHRREHTVQTCVQCGVVDVRLGQGHSRAVGSYLGVRMRSGKDTGWHDAKVGSAQ